MQIMVPHFRRIDQGDWSNFAMDTSWRAIAFAGGPVCPHLVLVPRGRRGP